MLKNYFKLAFRNMRRNAVYSFINIFGLAVGLASVIVIGMWVLKEYSYDRHFQNADRIYRIGVNFMNIGDMAPGPEGFSGLAKDLPEVSGATSLDLRSETTVFVEDQPFEEATVFFADSSYFNVFSYPFVEGNRETALNRPGSVVLTRSKAQKFFGKESAVGETLLLGEEQKAYTVTGIVNKEGLRTHIPADMWFYFDPGELENWTSANYYNYLLLRKGVTRDQLEDRLSSLTENRIYPQLSSKLPYDEWMQSSRAYKFIVMPLTDIYLTSDLRFELTAGGNASNVRVFAWVAMLILLIAAVNFVNITTARSANRAREVGIRKSLGTGRSALIFQFLMESILMTLIALAFAVGLAELFLSMFESYTGISLMDGLYQSTGQLLAILGIVLLIGLTAGLYPAFYLSSYKPVTVLKGKLYGNDNSLFRNGLVAVQFVIASTLIIGMLMIYQQLNFMQTKNMGLEPNNVLVVQNADELGEQQDLFQQQMTELPGVTNVSSSSRIPTSNRVIVGTLRTPAMEEGIPMQTFFGDHNYLSTLGFQLKQGRNFYRERASDLTAVILNESAVRALELEDPLGVRLYRGERIFTVIGVVHDFNFESLRNQVEPAVILYREQGSRLAAKVKNVQLSFVTGRLQSIWESLGPEEPMDYYFLDDSYAQLMQKEKTLSRAVTLFAILAIIISCLGLYGLSAYMCEQRTREIGIRKVLGANIYNILMNLNVNFLKPVGIAILVAVPLSYLFVQSWLENFAYKIEMSLLTFVGGCLLALGIALVSVSWQSIRTAKMNPADSLRSE